MEDTTNLQKVLIYIPLLDESVSVARPTYGQALENNIFRVLPTEKYNPENEIWEFPPGTVVKCEKKVMLDGTQEQEVLLAIEIYKQDKS